MAVPLKWWEGLDDDMPGSHTSDAIVITLKYAALVQGSRRGSATCSISWEGPEEHSEGEGSEGEGEKEKKSLVLFAVLQDRRKRLHPRRVRKWRRKRKRSERGP